MKNEPTILVLLAWAGLSGITSPGRSVCSDFRVHLVFCGPVGGAHRVQVFVEFFVLSKSSQGHPGLLVLR